MIRHISALAALVALSLTSVACAGAAEDDTNQAEETSQDLVSGSATFGTFQGADGQHYFHLVASNGEIVLASEAYTTRESAEKGMAAVMDNGHDKRNFDIRKARDGQWYFTLSATNDEVIGTSELYTTRANAERGAATVRAFVRIEQQKTAI